MRIQAIRFVLISVKLSDTLVLLTDRAELSAST